MTLIRRLERGSVEQDFAFVAYTPFLVAILLAAVALAMVGFWRAGAVVANERGAYEGATALGGAAAGHSRQLSALQLWAGGVPPAQAIDYQVVSGQRAAVASVRTRSSFMFGPLGQWLFSVPAQTAKRWERFYPGPPDCSDGQCNE